MGIIRTDLRLSQWLQLRDATPFWDPPNDRAVIEKIGLKEVMCLKFEARTAEQIYRMAFEREIARSNDAVKSVVTSRAQMAEKCKPTHLANCSSRLRVRTNCFSCGICISCYRATETLCNVNFVASLVVIYVYYNYGQSPLIQRLSPTCTVVAFREFQRKSDNWILLLWSTKHVHTSWNANSNTLEPVRPQHDRPTTSYLPTVCFHHLRLLALSLHKE
jgi:hypothetical protein